MNVETGEIREFDDLDSLQKALATGEWEELTKRPEKSCKLCYGGGYTGYDTGRKRYVVCGCVKKIKNET